MRMQVGTPRGLLSKGMKEEEEQVARASHQLPRWPPPSKPWPTETLALGSPSLPELTELGGFLGPLDAPSPSATLADPFPTALGPAAPRGQLPKGGDWFKVLPVPR